MSFSVNQCYSLLTGVRYVIFQNSGDEFEPMTVNRVTLQTMEPNAVLICRWPPPLRYQFYRNLMPDVQITLCNFCFKVNHRNTDFLFRNKKRV